MKRTLLCLNLIVFAFCRLFADKPVDSKYFPPTAKAKSIALLLLGGSEGGLPEYYDTESLTGKGYPCMILGYFGTQNTPNSLEMIPLEYFEKALEEFGNKAEVKHKKIIVWGGSKGGELALLLASKYPRIGGVIATVPSSVVFQGIGGSVKSSWSYKGKGIPFVPYADFDWSKIVNNQYVEVYQLSLLQSDLVEKAAIEVENINGPILILSGKADAMWPSSQMGDMIIQRLEDKKFKFPFYHFSYEDAGHTLNATYMMGGTSEGNEQAGKDVITRINQFLDSFDQQ